MRKVKYYSLLEVMAVMSLLLLMSGMLFSAFYRYHRDFLNSATRNTVSSEVFQLREQFRRAVDGCRGPLQLTGEKITSGGAVAAAVADGKIELRIDGRARPLVIPGGLNATLSLEEDNRLAVLTLSDNPRPNSKPRLWRIAVATGGGSNHEK